MRTFRLSSPLMTGASKLQEGVNKRLTSWKIPASAFLVVDDQYGPDSKKMVKTVGYGLGIADIAAILDHSGCTPDIQRKIELTGQLTPEEKARYDARADWRRRLRDRYGGQGVEASVKFAMAMAAKGIVEHPHGSNLGPYITDWEELTGYRVRGASQGVPWCGCWVNACLVAGGFHSEHFLGYVPYIGAHGHNKIDGWRWASPGATPQAGWVACFGNFAHTEYVVRNGTPLRTVGGNTSKGDGSPNEGGGLYYHNFSTYSGMRLDGYAIPPWSKV